MSITPAEPARCEELKRGKFARLRCIKDEGHEGAHDFRVLGVREDPKVPRQPNPGMFKKNAPKGVRGV